MTIDRIIFNGVSMTPDWPAKIEAAQQFSHYLIAGEEMPRIRYGEEEDDWGADHKPCHDCFVLKGQFHVGPGCDVERCPSCGGQVIGCDCEYYGDEPEQQDAV
jgi:hypothetical protein